MTYSRSDSLRDKAIDLVRIVGEIRIAEEILESAYARADKVGLTIPELDEPYTGLAGSPGHSNLATNLARSYTPESQANRATRNILKEIYGRDANFMIQVSDK